MRRAGTVPSPLEGEGQGGGWLRQLSRPLTLQIVACAAWGILLIAVSVLVVRSPIRSIFDAYRDGVHHWWASEPLYNASDPRGFVYLTSSPLLITPFVLLGPPFDDLLWRLCSVALFLFGLWRLARILIPEQAPLAMAVIMLLILPASGVNVQRGQAEMAMAGIMFPGAADAATRRWWRAAALLCLGFALKPLALVLILLYGALYRPLRIPLAVGVLIVLAAPFLHSDPGYVLAQDRAMIDTLLTAAQPGVTRFNDVAMMLHRFGTDVPAPVMLAIRFAAAALTLWLALIAARTMPHAEGAITVLALAVTYLVLFNPRTELGSYMNLGALAGLFTATAWVRGQRATAVLLALLVLGLGTQAYGNWIYRPTDVWLKPLLGLVYFGYLAYRIYGGRLVTATAG
jgi:alpha-1,2-mannosyltransferase